MQGKVEVLYKVTDPPPDCNRYFVNNLVLKVETMHSKRRTYHLQTAVQKQSRLDADEDKKHFFWKGLLFAIISSVFYSIDAIFVKLMKNLDPIQLALYRFIIMFIMCLPEVVKCGKNPFGPKDVRVFLLLRGFLGGTSIFLVYTSYRFLSLGESYVITSSLPIFVTLSACIFLKEPCGFVHSVIVLFTFIGIIFTTKVPSLLLLKDVSYTTENTYGILSALGALLCRTFMVLFIRKAKKADHSVMVFNYGWVSIVVGLILLFLLTEFKWHRCGIQWFYILMIGVTGFLSQTFLILSLKCELAGPVSTVMGGVRIILAFLWQTIIFYDIPGYLTIIGAVTVIFCMVLLGLKKWVSALPESSMQRKKLKWTLL